MLCSAVAPWGETCVREHAHWGDHQTATQRAQAQARYDAEREAFWAACADRAAARRRVAPPLVPVVLVPTAAQRAAGRNLVDATEEQIPRGARALMKAAAAAGWTVRATYAHALMPPKRGTEDWWDAHTVAVRLAHPDGRRAWGCWSNGTWDGGQVRGRNIGARELTAYVSDASLDSQVRQLVGSAA